MRSAPSRIQIKHTGKTILLLVPPPIRPPMQVLQPLEAVLAVNLSRHRDKQHTRMELPRMQREGTGSSRCGPLHHLSHQRVLSIMILR